MSCTDVLCLAGGVWQDEGRRVAVEVREVFRQRKDGLQERRAWPLKDTTWELLGPGARGALKQATIVKGQRRDLLFYHQVPTRFLCSSWLRPPVLAPGADKFLGGSWLRPVTKIQQSLSVTLKS